MLSLRLCEDMVTAMFRQQDVHIDTITDTSTGLGQSGSCLDSSSPETSGRQHCGDIGGCQWGYSLSSAGDRGVLVY